MKFAATALAAILIVGAATGARADSGEAERLFRDGKALMADGAYEKACAAFEASQALDPGLNTLLNLANCREKNQQLATAWSLFLDAETLASSEKDEAMRKTSHQRATALEPRVSHLTVEVSVEARLSGLTIARNGQPLDPKLWNQRLPIDGGSITILVSAPGHEEWRTTIELALEKASESIAIPLLVESVVPDEPEPDVVTKPLEPQEVVQHGEGSSGGMTGRRKVALVVGALGIAGLGVSAALGYHAAGLEDDAAALCPEIECSDADEANQLLDRARTQALFANIGYGVGAAAVIGAAVLWLTGAPEQRAPTVSLRIGPHPSVQVGLTW